MTTPLAPFAFYYPFQLTPLYLIELGIGIWLYSLVLTTHVGPTFGTYAKYHSASPSRTLSSIVLAIHIISSMGETLSWHLRYLSSMFYRSSVTSIAQSYPLPTNFDFALAMIQCASSLALAKYMRRGQSLMTRPTFQAGPVLRVVLCVLAWYWKDAVMYRGSIKTLDGFLWTRMVIVGVQSYCRRNWRESSKWNEVYNIGTFTGVIIAVADVEIPHAPKIYVALVIAVAMLNHWVTNECKLKTSQTSISKSLLLSFLVFCGFAELETIETRAGLSFTAKNEMEANKSSGTAEKASPIVDEKSIAAVKVAEITAPSEIAADISVMPIAPIPVVLELLSR